MEYLLRLIDEEYISPRKDDDDQITIEEDVINVSIDENSQSPNGKLVCLEREMEFEQFPCTLADYLPSTQILEIDEVEYAFHIHVVSMLDIKKKLREDFTYLHSKIFYSLHIDLFDGFDGLAFTKYYISLYSFKILCDVN